ncbi:MAG: hypothetical protein FWF81_08795 [Defluviitaleaceae bacterium]|nr:hypothetical protein [Defluviitaleaceae bacterium]
MPLVFPPKPTAFFNRTREPLNNEETGDNSPGLRHFPLNAQNAHESHRRAVPVAPLQHLLQKPQAVQAPMQAPMQPRMPMPPMQHPPMQNPPMQQPPSQMPMIPQQQPPPQMPMIPQQQPPPEQAAEQFRRANKNLPDGVRYEPLDEETMRILREKNPKFQAPPQQVQPQSQPPLPQSPPPQQVQPPQPPSQSFTAQSEEIIKRLAQDERNSHVFYNHFAHNATFAILAKDSKARLEQYTALLAMQGKPFIPLETTINTEIEISEAIKLALSEENKGLIALGNLLDLSADTPSEKVIGRILNKKIIGHQLLLSLK